MRADIRNVYGLQFKVAIFSVSEIYQRLCNFSVPHVRQEIECRSGAVPELIKYFMRIFIL